MNCIDVPDLLCGKCDKVTSIYENNNNYTIKKLLYKLKNGKKIEYYLDCCKCEKQQLLNEDEAIYKFNVPTRKAISEIMYKLYYRNNYGIYHKNKETFMPSNKEYLEIILRILTIRYNPLKFNFINKYNVINLNLEDKIRRHYYDIVIHNYMVENSIINNTDIVDKENIINSEEKEKVKNEYRDLRWMINQTNLEKSNYYRRIIRLKKSKIFDYQYMALKKKMKAASFLRNSILDSMYDLKTELGQRMFDVRLRLNGLDEYIIN